MQQANRARERYGRARGGLAWELLPMRSEGNRGKPSSLRSALIRQTATEASCTCVRAHTCACMLRTPHLDGRTFDGILTEAPNELPIAWLQGFAP